MLFGKNRKMINSVEYTHFVKLSEFCKHSRGFHSVITIPVLCFAIICKLFVKLKYN